MLKKVFIFIALLSLIMVGCKKAVEPEAEKQLKTVTLKGQVLESATNAPLQNAVVRVLGITPTLIAYTDSLGKYEFQFEIESEIEVQLVAF
ncbi:hypothetical protein JGI15_101130, partial [Candidatus Kryptonium thompsonii]